MVEDIMKYNKIKISELSKKIAETNGDYRLICIDVDDVIFDIANLMQEILADIDYRATNKYREMIVNDETSEDAKLEFKKSYKILDAILEENKCVVEKENGQKEYLDFTKPLIDYEKVYEDKNLFPLAIQYVKNMIANRGPNEYYIFLSHRNPIREGIIKTKRLYELIPEIDGIITLPFHEGTNEMTDKGLWVLQTLQLDNLNNAILIDNSKSNCKKWRAREGIDIRFEPDGFNVTHSLADHLSRLTELDSYNLQLCYSFIKYVRDNPGYADLYEHKIKVKRR